MSWTKPVDTSDTLAELDYATERVRDAARDIRHCENCAASWIDTAPTRRCSCYTSWLRAMDQWRAAKAEMLKAAPHEHVDLPPECLNFQTPSPKPPYAAIEAIRAAKAKMFGIGRMPEMEEVW